MAPHGERNRNPNIDERVLTLCCKCIPIRLGVFLIAAFAVMTGVVSGFGKALGVDTSALFGGYVLQSKVLITFLELSGLVWGFMGMLGAKNCSAGFTQVFLYYQYVRMFSWIGIFYYDLPALWTCEAWLTDIANQEWNPRMYAVAMQGECFTRRWTFLIVACISMCLFGYFTSVNYVFYKMLEDGLPYTIESSKFVNSSSFAAQSLVEKRPLIMNKYETALRRDPHPEVMEKAAGEWVVNPTKRPDSPVGYQPAFQTEEREGASAPVSYGETAHLWHAKNRGGAKHAVDASEP